MDESKKQKIQTSETFLLSAILAISGGFQDAYTYNVREEVFSNAQTGNVVLMSQHFLMGDWRSALHYLFPILAFAFGVLVAEQIGHKYKYAKKTKPPHRNQAGGSATLAWSSVGWQAEVYSEIQDHHDLKTEALLTAYAR